VLNPASPLARLMAAPMRPGVVEWLGVRPARLAPMRASKAIALTPGQGALGDHYHSATQGARQVTVIAAEHLAAIGSYLGQDSASPELLRRNVVVRGINLGALKTRRFRLGGALLECSGECHPCSKMERLLGAGGYNAVRGHGGITAWVLEGGEVRLGDLLVPLD
jgi:MOSC domain-containing protein YiiM